MWRRIERSNSERAISKVEVLARLNEVLAETFELDPGRTQPTAKSLWPAVARRLGQWGPARGARFTHTLERTGAGTRHRLGLARGDGSFWRGRSLLAGEEGGRR
jgi:hypothetical protein